MTNRNLILFLAFLTLIGFPLLGYLVFYFFGEGNLSEILYGEINPLIQILYGFPLGIIAAILAQKMIGSQLMKPVLKKYANLVGDLELKPWMIIYVSICAGVGEELFFRAALQPLWGVWITSIVFVAIHGYLNPMDWRLSIYGFYLTGVIIGVGFMFIHWGIWAAAAAHTAIDIVLLYYLSKNKLI